MSDDATLVYLEADDEVTSVARRLRAADDERVVLVTPGRSRATSSAVALRLLARIGEDAGRRVAVVGDALTRSLAAEAGLETYASVDDARTAAAPLPADTQLRSASIHVVRGAPEGDVTQAVPLAAVAVAAAAPVRTDDATRVRPAVALRPAARRRSIAPVRRVGATTLLGIGVILAALLLSGGVAGAVLLPAATITVTPRAVPLGPIEYDLTIDDAERISGTAEAAATVTATGTYPIQAPAAGSVTFFNWTFAPATVPAGTFVAAGEQAFATQADIEVARGALTGQGTIRAGETSVEVVAAAIGPAANVPAGAINTIVSSDLDARLRGFPENTQPTVLNAAPTAGGIDTTGPELTQADADPAVAAITEEVSTEVADALEPTRGSVFADAVDPAAAPTIPGLEGLVGTRDQPEAALNGSLAYDRHWTPRDDVVAAAEERLAVDASALPPDHELLPAETEVTIGEARVDAGELVVTVSVTGASAAVAEHAEILGLVRGLSASDAHAALEDIGPADVELWPGWVGTVPELDWRIDLRIGTAGGGDDSAPSVGDAPSGSPP